MKLTGESRSTRGKKCSSAMLSATNPTWTDPGSNPGLRGERPVTNHGTVKRSFLANTTETGVLKNKVVPVIAMKVYGRMEA
jgi:hypothetical protein